MNAWEQAHAPEIRRELAAWLEAKAPTSQPQGSSSGYGVEDDATWTTRFFNGVGWYIFHL
jgi:hypothetical protein